MSLNLSGLKFHFCRTFLILCLSFQVSVVAQMMISLIFAECTFTCSIRCLWRTTLSPSSGTMNLVQVDAEVIGKGTVLIYRKDVKDFGQSEL